MSEAHAVEIRDGVIWNPGFYVFKAEWWKQRSKYKRGSVRA